MNSAYKRIVVVGGGTAGWMTAVGLATALPACKVELVESEEIGIVGVGEATFPMIRAFHKSTGIDEAEFLRATNGTFKLGIEFRDWRAKGQRFFHTFGNFDDLTGPACLWGQYRRVNAPTLGPLSEQCLPSVMASQGRFAPPPKEQANLYSYAYHFDANLYAGFLRGIALKRGARRTEGRIVEVKRRADGGVDQLKLEDGRVVAGDLFIDCSGFVSLLLGRALEEPFVDFSRWLPVDRAWAVPSEPSGPELTPHTVATALEAGWTWRIPLSNRIGNGHVFASRYIDEERARTQLLEQLDGPALAEPRLLRFTTGHRERFWVHNVVGLGLSSGFLEPLESTSILLIQRGLEKMIELLRPGARPAAAAVANYNRGMTRVFERIRDFLILHYCLTERRDSQLWRDMASMELPETLDFKLHAWRQTGSLNMNGEEGFEATSWLAIHAGMGNWPVRADPVLAEVPAAEALQALHQRRDHYAAVVATMPTHEAFLRRMLGR
ncbi:tryptophan halogenase family protein [Pseudoduganella namucuonensis]|uniref:Tryptophan halogenase n=1 Tax=Pseudoduganella namucuonensis TaxID=1035707 RepID=A0A1I7KUM9_9BURK|nr:tryptophan halogenase family protein [Pseudoduganella namucuonensis]SFV01014.1 tryptophan halogenase [Pseudoduganella namucuonensis]